MKIAFSAAANEGLTSPISPHFGRCPYYVFVELDADNQITDVSGIANGQANQHAPGQMPAYIKELGVNVMISGGMGSRAVDFFHQYDIQVATGASGTVQESLKNYLDGNLYGDEPCTESVAHEKEGRHHHDHRH